jgi:hypothetical protein|tara:strand:+ start:1003 stop:1194 length:192 start_codon:yes stop_codon:yes gene_type:complete
MNKKRELMEDILAVNTVIEEVWNYHPSNPNKLDIEEEYDKLMEIKSDLQKELVEFEKSQTDEV